MAVLTVSLVAQHPWPFISGPNFSPLVCSTVPLFNASCPRVAPTSAPSTWAGGSVVATSARCPSQGLWE